MASLSPLKGGKQKERESKRERKKNGPGAIDSVICFRQNVISARRLTAGPPLLSVLEMDPLWYPPEG